MVFKWRDGYVELFLDLYREHECLWNINSELYKNKIAREIAYQEICESMNLPGLLVSDVKNKIKIIRTNYKSELNKIIKSEIGGSGPLDVYTPRVFWFKKADEFLRGVCEVKGSPSLSYRDSDQHPNDKIVEDVEESTESLENSNLNVQRVSKSEYSKNQNTTKIKKSKKRSSKSTTVGSGIKTFQKMFEICRDDDDEFDLFGRSIAIQLKKMPLERALICQESIQAVVRHERVYQLSRNFSTNTERSNTIPAMNSFSPHQNNLS